MDGLCAVLWPLAFWSGILAVGACALFIGGVRGPLLLVGALPAAVLAETVLELIQTRLSVPFTWLTVSLTAVTLGLLAALLRRIPAGRPVGAGASVREDRWPSTWAVALAMVGSTATAYVVVWLAGGGDWEVASQTWDTFFDANAIRAAAQSQILAPNRITDFASPGPLENYYPSSFHGLGVLLVQMTGCDAVVATNVVAGLIAGAIWPATAALASHYVLGRRALLPALVLAWGFHGMPWSPLGWGVLWATSLAATAIPLCLAALAGLLGVTRVPRDRRVGGVLTAGMLVLVAVLHPRIGVVTATVLQGPWVWVLGARAVHAWRAGKHRLAAQMAVVGVAPTLMLALAAVGVRRTGELVSRAWAILQSRVAEVTQYFLGGPVQSVPRLLVALLVIAGAVRAWRSRELRWLVCALVVAVGLDIATATTNYLPAFNALARYWYNDRHRTVVVPPAAGVLLAVVGWEQLRSRLGDRSAWRQWRAAGTAVGAVVVLAWGAVGGLSYLRPNYIEAAEDPVVSFVSAQDRAFYQAVAQRVPEGQWVLNNPWDGSGLLFAYTGVHTVFIQLNGTPTTYNGVALRDRLVTMSREEACRTLRADKVHWVLNGGAASLSNPGLPPQVTPNMEIPAGFWATTLVEERGDLRLYEITGCGAY